MYDVDTRLRPDGSKGLLVASVDAFEAYQRDRAWTWEHQALLRARPVAGDPRVGATLAGIRRDILSARRATPRGCVRKWGRCARAGVASATVPTPPVSISKQGVGALIDIEFVLQGMVLAHAAAHPSLLDSPPAAR